MTVRRPGQRGRKMPGATVCPQCLEVVDNAAMVEMVRPGLSHGIWWCAACADRVAPPGTRSA
jgi:hypothetical protein